MNTDMTTLRVVWGFRGRKKKPQTLRRGLAEDLQGYRFTGVSQRIGKEPQRTLIGLTEDSQKTQRVFIRVPKSSIKAKDSLRENDRWQVDD